MIFWDSLWFVYLYLLILFLIFKDNKIYLFTQVYIEIVKYIFEFLIKDLNWFAGNLSIEIIDYTLCKMSSLFDNNIIVINWYFLLLLS